MKKIALILSLMLILQPFAFGESQWELDNVLSTTNPTNLATVIQQNNDALDRLDRNYRRDCTVIPDTASQVAILPGEIMICNSAGTNCEMRLTAANTTVSWADIDTGAEAVSTQYYVYATADTDIVGFVEKISSSSTAPSGATAYRKIGYFYNNSAGDIESVGNMAGGDVVNSVYLTNSVQRSTTSTSYADIDSTTIRFVSSGRPVLVIFKGAFSTSGNQAIGVKLYVDADVDSTQNGEYANSGYNQSPYYGQELGTFYYGIPTAGAHTIKAKYVTSANTLYAERTLIVAQEL